MMRLRNAIWLSAALLLSGIFSCSRQEEMPATAGGSVAITFSTGLQTKAAPGDGVVADGGGIYVDGSGTPDIHVFIFDGNDDIVARYLSADATFNSIPAECFSHTSTTATILFTDVPAGDYSVYAVANTEGTGNWLGDMDWTSIDEVSDLESIVFPALALGTAPTMDSGRLPLSAKGTLNVSSRHTGEVNLEMLRCTGKITVQLIDQTDNGLSMSNLSVTLSGMNATKGYLFAHDPEAPAGIGYGDISISDATSDPSDRVTFTSGVAEYPTYVFPQANGPYTCDISFDVHYDEGGTPVTYSKSFSDLPIQNFRAENIMSIARNQHLIIQIRISEGHMVSFNFIVGGWTELEESVEFD